MDDGNITQWIGALKTGDQEAARKLWDGYFQKLVRLVERKLPAQTRRAFDEEDVALSAFKSFCFGVAEERFPDLSDRGNLWAILVIIATRKAQAYFEGHHRQKRGGGKVRGDSVFLAQGNAEERAGFDGMVGKEPTPAFLAQAEEECQRLLEALGDDTLRDMAVLKIQGFTIDDHVDGEVLARFDAEARTVARLSHPNIVQIYEVGEHEGRPYIALEYVEGGSLANHLDGAPQAPRAAAQLVETVARAMHFAHAQGIVHRDLKPANILLASGGSGSAEGSRDTTDQSPLTTQQPKITDFGLAKMVGPEAATAPDLRTKTGVVVGTPSYMAPEQVRSGVLPLGPAADVYALGVILYELLTGRPPFLGANMFDTLEQVCFQEPVPLRQLQSRTPLDLETICLKCLRKEPHQRYVTAQALADDLRRWLDGRPILARPVGPLARAARWCRRNPGVALLTATAILATLLGSGFSIWFGVQATANAGELLVKKGELETRTGELETKREELSKTVIHLATEKAKAEEATREVTLQKEVVERQLLRNRWFVYAGLLDKTSKELQGAPKDPTRRERAAAFLDRCSWDLRHWEHACLRQQCAGVQPMRHKLPGGEVIVWETRTGKRVRTFRLAGTSVNSVCFSPDGTQVAAGVGQWSDSPRGFHRGAVKVWDVLSGQERLSLDVGLASVFSVAFSPDGQRLAAGRGEAGNTPGMAWLWETATGKPLHNLGGFPHLCVAFDRAGKRLVCGGESGTFVVWGVPPEPAPAPGWHHR